MNEHLRKTFAKTKHAWIIDAPLSEIVEPWELDSFDDITTKCSIQLNTINYSGAVLQCLNPKFRKTFNTLTKLSWTILPLLSIVIPLIFSEYKLLFCLLIYPIAWLGSSLIKNMFSVLTWLISISLSIYFAFTGVYIGILTALLPLIMLLMQKYAKRYFMDKILTAAYTDELSFKTLLLDNLIQVQDESGNYLKIKNSRQQNI